MSAIGADPGQLDSLANQFDQLSSSLGHRRLTLTAWIEGDRFWRGPRANEFRHLWATQYGPQIGRAVDFLNEQVRALHDNANQQRVASGEQPKDYGSSFVNKLWGEAKGDVSSVEHKASHGISSLFHHVEHSVENVGKRMVTDTVDAAKDIADGTADIASDFYAGVKVLGGSKEFAEVLGAVQVVGVVAAFLPPPADVVGLVAGGIVMAGHLAQMANRGKFNPVEFAEDAIPVAGGAAIKALATGGPAVEAAENVNILRNLADDDAQAKLIAYASKSNHVASVVAVQSIRGVEAAGDLASTTGDTLTDIEQHHYGQAFEQSVTGTVAVVADLSGSHSDDIAHLSSAANTAAGLDGQSVPDELAELGGYDE